MTEKIRVKDISTELGVTSKAIIQACRELDIQVKSHMSVLTEEEAVQLRSHIKESVPDAEVVTQEVQPGAVVRRRRKKAAPSAEKPEKAKIKTKDAGSAPSQEVPEKQEKPAKETKAKPKKGRAKIIKPVTEEQDKDASNQPLPSAPEEEDAKQEMQQREKEEQKKEEVAPVTEERKTDDPLSVAEDTVKTPEADTAVKAKEQAKPVAKQKKSAPEKEKPISAVKIISRPDPVAQKAEKEKATRTKGKPASPRYGDDGGSRSAKRPGAQPGIAPVPENTDGRRRKKNKRVVEFSHKKDGGMHENERAFMQKKGRKPKKEAEPAVATQPQKAGKRKVRIDEAIRVADLAKQMGLKAQMLIKALFELGVMATINASLDFETAQVLCSDFGYEVEKVGFSESEYLVPKEEDSPDSLKPRAPVVTIMGHVDHGKTSLLDAIRLAKTSITSGEAGGITQHIGAYDVTTPRGKIVFLDTPGHEAFTAMRARGAKVTDIVILVVAADDGVMEQTREAVSHAKAAEVPIIVAVNKIDKEGANPERVMRELAELDLAPEEWGGQTIYCNVSAKTGENLETLLEMVLLQAEVMELVANPEKRALGHIVEARLDKGRGPVATVLIEGGTLRAGDCFVCGVQSGKVRAMRNDTGRKIKTAGPATPVEVQGFEGIPLSGDEFVCVEDEKVARRIAQNRLLKQRERKLASESKVTLESFLASRPDAESKTLNLVLKADVQGSQEAIADALNKLSTQAVKVNILHSGAGAITESDILLAAASQAIIIGFNVRPTAKVKEVAEHENVEIRFYEIIYKLVGEIKDAMAGMLAPVVSEEYLGQAEVRDTFTVPKVGVVAGCYVVDGELRRNARVRLLREGVVIYTGTLSSLKRFKDDAKEVRRGYECGAGLEKFNDIKIGDVIEAFMEVESAATLD